MTIGVLLVAAEKPFRSRVDGSICIGLHYESRPLGICGAWARRAAFDLLVRKCLTTSLSSPACKGCPQIRRKISATRFPAAA
jgi:hypothetical protein